MNTTYDNIFIAFKDNITDPDLLEFSKELQDDTLIALMEKAISKCKRIVLKTVDLSLRDNDAFTFLVFIPDEVIELITEWMTVFWLTPFLNNTENLRNVLNTKDFSLYSPANLLDKIENRYKSAKKQARSMTNEYSYVVADMSRLKS